MYSDIVDFVTTKEQRDQLVKKLTAFLAFIDETGDASLAKDIEKFQPDVQSFLKKSLPPDEKAVKTWLREAIQKISVLSVVTITAPVYPSGQFLTRLQEWLSRESKQKLLLDFKIEPGIFGGAIIELNGKYGDYSLKQSVSVYFQTNKDKIVNLLSSTKQ